MYHKGPMAPTVRRASGLAFGLILGLGIGLGSTGCASTSARPTERRYEPGAHRAHQEPLQLELLIAQYDERQLTLRVVLHNAGTTPARVHRRGILLAYQDLEFPVQIDPDAPIPERITIAPGDQRELWLGFETGSRIVQPAVLRLRAVEPAAESSEVLELAIEPAPPAREAPQDRVTRSPRDSPALRG